jgi:Zn-dependent protease with chaperone function
MVIAVSVLWVPYLLLRRSPRRWWLWTSLAAVPFLILMLLVQPVLIAPLFDDFGPMQDKALEARILALAERAGIDGGQVFEVNKSADTDAVNAYVGGLFGTQRIVLWDTLLARLAPAQVLVVMGHEMGHFVLGHIWVLCAPPGHCRTGCVRQSLPALGTRRAAGLRRLLPGGGLGGALRVGA